MWVESIDIIWHIVHTGSIFMMVYDGVPIAIFMFVWSKPMLNIIFRISSTHTTGYENSFSVGSAKYEWTVDIIYHYGGVPIARTGSIFVVV